MKIITRHINLNTKGEVDIIDLTNDVKRVISEVGVKSGIVTVFVSGSTGGVTTIEYESGLLKDFPAMFERIIPRNVEYEHEQRWHDGNGHSHVRAALLGPSITVPLENGGLTLGTWQQLVFVEFDNRSRRRELIVQIMGE